MVYITSFIVLALSALPTFTDAAHISSHIHHHAALQRRSAGRACRSKIIPPPTRGFKDKDHSKDGPGSSSASVSKTKTSASAKSTSTSSSKDDGKVSDEDNDEGNTPDVGSSTGKLGNIFPLNTKSSSKSFSTSPRAPNPLPLSDATLHPSHGRKSDARSYVTAPDGRRSLRATYRKGSISPGHSGVPGGFSFYSPTPIDLTDGNTVTMSYSVYFDKGFQFKKGGKLPGLYGGDSDEEATKCSGGRHPQGCWSLRMMWRRGGAGELYAYLPQTSKNTKALSTVPPHTADNDAYGHSVGRGLFRFTPGRRTTIAQRVTLNTPGKYDGSVEVYVDGKSVFVAHGLLFRSSSKGKVRGIQMQTFFGGHDGSWASPATQNAYFSDISAAVFN